MSDRPDTDSGGVDLKPRQEIKPKLQRPRLYRVLYLNDDYTSFQFVHETLRAYFNKTPEEAAQITDDVHKKGVGLAGVFTYEVAETKQLTVMALAQKLEFPLKLVIEPDDSGNS